MSRSVLHGGVLAIIGSALMAMPVVAATTIRFDVPGAEDTNANAINDAGWIAGDYTTSGTSAFTAFCARRMEHL